jgi:hypothetical protein
VTSGGLPGQAARRWGLTTFSNRTIATAVSHTVFKAPDGLLKIPCMAFPNRETKMQFETVGGAACTTIRQNILAQPMQASSVRML